MTIEELLDLAGKVLEKRGWRKQQDAEAVEAEAKALQERGEADAANVDEDTTISAFKQAANDYVKE